MAIKALTLSETFEHVSDTDPSKIKKTVPVDPKDPAKGTKEEVTIEEGATVFGLKPLDVFLMGHIYDNASTLTGKQGSEDIGIHTRVNQTNIEAVKFGLAYFKNFKDEKGNDLVVKPVKAHVNGREYDAASDETLKHLGNRLIAELAREIKEKSEVTKDDEKNSD
ncbi:hypothetical protein [Hyphomicrobium sp.]|uniref:hypothetical protein n=1 Tax=Hyphomicrobium sp. TaxID=82 RepID=UPI001D76F014|nr:hypothetical protein [Hyphomicrobium sp.]MBY0560011.1 hypothetical protein [Hyphomicrobium sp.]